MNFNRVKNTPYISGDFDFKICFRARQFTGSFEKRAPGLNFSPFINTKCANHLCCKRDFRKHYEDKNEYFLPKLAGTVIIVIAISIFVVDLFRDNFSKTSTFQPVIFSTGADCVSRK